MSSSFGDPGSPETDHRYPFLGDYGYVGGGGGPSESCGCKFSCYPQFHARWESTYNTRDKAAAAFPEFGSASSPPRFFLRLRTTYRCYVRGDDAVSTFWEQVDIDVGTGGDTPTYSDPEFTGNCPAWTVSGPGTVTIVSPTVRRTVWKNDDDITYMLTKLEVLSKEYTTEMLTNLTIDELPSWAPDDVSWPGANTPGFPAPAYYVDGGICYRSGSAPWSVAERLQVPSSWQLSTDETEFAVQRVRYKIVFPHFIGTPTFRVEWKERFLPAVGALESPTNPQFVTQAGGELESAIHEITNREGENGENFICCARFVPIA